MAKVEDAKKKSASYKGGMGNEANFRSSSRSGSISVPEVHVSAAGNQRSSFSHSHGRFGWNHGSLSYKSRACPIASCEKDSLSTVGKSQPSAATIHQNFGASSTSSSNSGSCKGSHSSPGMRQSGRYSSCGENYSIKPQNPEQYSTTLQQQEVMIQHLKTKLTEMERKLKERDTEIEGLKAQLGRMKEEWVEEECTRMEVELAFWEARKEIKELKKMNESMKKRLAEKDKKIWKYFIDISEVNKKLEYLLAQNSSGREEQCPQYTCDGEGNPSALSATVPASLITEDQALEKAADSGLLLSDDTANKSDSFEESLTTTTSELSDPAPSHSAVNPEALENIPDEKLTSAQEKEKISTVMVEQASQNDVVPDGLDVEQIVQNIVRPQDACPLSPLALLKESGQFSLGSLSDSGVIADLTPNDPNAAILWSPTASPCRKVEHRVNENHFVKECDLTEPAEAITDCIEQYSTKNVHGWEFSNVLQ